MTEKEAINLFRTDFENVGDVIVSAMVQEIAAQGHKATGKLMQSVVNNTQKLLDGIENEISYLNYGKIVNSGVSANRIPYSRGSGAGQSKFISALMNWVRFKGIAGGLDKNILRATFAIARKMKKEGMPTRGSYQFTSNGRRLEWSDYVILTKTPYIETEIEDISERYIENIFAAKLQQIADQYQLIYL